MVIDCHTHLDDDGGTEKLLRSMGEAEIDASIVIAETLPGDISNAAQVLDAVRRSERLWAIINCVFSRALELNYVEELTRLLHDDALPYNDKTVNGHRPEAPRVVPWFKEAYQGPGVSTCKALKPCVYVGMTGLPVDQRFENHKNGYKSAWVVKKYGLRLMPELYEHLNPMPFEAAAQMEIEIG